MRKVKKFWRWIRKQLDKLPSGGDGLHRSGQWRVQYPEYDDWKSVKMCYDTAKDYAKIFNGKVIYARYE